MLIPSIYIDFKYITYLLSKSLILLTSINPILRRNILSDILISKGCLWPPNIKFLSTGIQDRTWKLNTRSYMNVKISMVPVLVQIKDTLGLLAINHYLSGKQIVMTSLIFKKCVIFWIWGIWTLKQLDQSKIVIKLNACWRCQILCGLILGVGLWSFYDLMTHSIC